jgi:hypothetical protein
VELNVKLPANVRFEKLPKNWPSDKSLPVRASYEKSDVAPIQDVIFFYGEVQKDGKIPAEAVQRKGQPDAKKQNAWTAELPPPGKIGLHRVSVAFTTITGKQKVESEDVIFLAPVAPGPQLTTLKGVVVHGSNPQSNTAVMLLDAKGKQLASVISDARGEFEFKEVAPGEYQVKSKRSTPPLEGQTPVTVVAGQTIQQPIRVELLSK